MSTSTTPYMTRAEAANYLRVKESWLRDHPEVPRVKLDGLVRYRRDHLDAWTEARRVAKQTSGRSARGRTKS